MLKKKQQREWLGGKSVAITRRDGSYTVLCVFLICLLGNRSAPCVAGQSVLPLKPSRVVKFTTHEGTNLSIDVSPDGRTIVFDLLGDLYVLPIKGGHARRITNGPAIDRQPRYSPDRRRILFLSDRTGEDAVWICDASGANARPILTAAHTTSVGFNFTDPIWLPDVNHGDAFILAMAYLSHGVGHKLAAFDTAGHLLESFRLGEAPTPASGFPYTSAPALGVKDAAGHRAIYATEVISAQQAGVGHVLQIVRIDPTTGARTTVTNESESAVAPVPSPDGRYLIYATTRPTPNGATTGLKLLDLRNNVVSWLVPEVEPSQHSSGVMVSEGHALLPHMAFTPDGRYLIAAHHGKLWRISIPSGRATQIPFTADVKQELGPLLRFPRRINDSEVTGRIVRDVRPSPDGKWLAFTALDRVWVLQKGETQPHQVTTNALAPGAVATEYTAAWSPDGQYLAFCTWTEHGGQISRVPTRLVTLGPVSPSDIERLTPEPDYYDKLVYTPEGTELVFIHARWQEALRSRDQTSSFDAPPARPELAAIPASGGSLRTLMQLEPRALNGQAPGYGWPHFSRRDPQSVFLFSGTTLWSVARSGNEHPRALATVAGVWPGYSDVLLSPRGDTAVIAQSVRSVLTFVVVPSITEPVRLSLPPDAKQDRSLPPFGGEDPWWSPDGALTYTLGHTYFVNDRATEIVVRVPADRPRGTLLLSNARVVTMGPAGVLEHGDVLVRDNRIVAVGPHGSLQVPDSAARMDLTGKTLLPGYVLTHEHVWEPYGVHVPRLWSYLAALAFGVTTIHDPQGNSLNRFSYTDVLETGAMLGPRHLSSGKAIEGGWPLDSLQETEQLAQRYARYYHSDTLKERGEGQRLVRQWLAIGAKEEQLTSVSHWEEDLESHVLDGYSGLEHSSFIPWYDDVVQLIARSESVYTPTTTVNSLRGSALQYFNAHYPFDCDPDPRLRRFASRFGCHFMLEHGPKRGAQPGKLDETTFKLEARSAAKLVAAGGHVAIGTDAAPFWGLPVHWEMWALAMGGMTPAQLLHSATRTGAEAMGLDQDLGSIELGKLADLQVLDRNPLEDIHNTVSVSLVMRNGRLYETHTLDEIWPEHRPFLATPDDKPWWQAEWPQCKNNPVQ